MLATGPVWLAATIETTVAAGGPAKKKLGERLKEYRVTVEITPDRFQPITNAHKNAFAATLKELNGRDTVTTVTRVDWRDGKAIVVVGVVAQDPGSAAACAAELVMRRATLGAAIGVEARARSTDLVGEWPVAL